MFMKDSDLQNYLRAAEVINKAYDVESTYDKNKKYDFVVVYDDDITAVLKSMAIFRQVKAVNPNAWLVVVGGEGLLNVAFKVMRFSLKVRGIKRICGRETSSLLVKETEAARLKRVAMALGVPEYTIVVSDKGRNTTENLQAISHMAQGCKTLVVSTQRLAMVFRQSADFQCNQEPEKHGCWPLDYDMYVIHQSVEETLRWYNFQIAGKGRVALHLYASLVRRFEVYDRKFLTKPFEPDEELKAADKLLRDRFLIKQRVGGLRKVRALLQYAPIIWDIFWHAEEYVKDEQDAILAAERF